MRADMCRRGQASPPPSEILIPSTESRAVSESRLYSQLQGYRKHGVDPCYSND